MLSSGGELTGLSLSARSAFDTANTPYSRALSEISSGSHAFVLSPYTSVTFNVDIDLRATSTAPLGDRTEGARAEARIGVSYVYGEATGGEWPWEYVSVSPWNAQDKSQQMTMSVSATIYEPWGGIMYFDTSVRAEAWTITSSVPEPSTWAMLLLGAALVPVAARRAGQQREQA